MEPESSLSYEWQPNIDQYPEPNKSVHAFSVLLSDLSSYYPPIYIQISPLFSLLKR
jgi:hypothetical protein